VFSNLNIWEIGSLLLLALFIFGPERLPKVLSDGARFLRSIREMARNATNDLSRELGTDVRLEDLHPKAFIRKHLLSEEDEATLRRPFDDAMREVKQIASDANEVTRPRSELPPQPRSAGYDPYPYQSEPPATGSYDQRPDQPAPDARRYDSDAT
jgi:sec-independent protein translocase protein TatB